jgi:RNA polymerase sigma factor (sigma-70 family)
MRPSDATPSPATSPHITDIYLAAACALKSESAWELLYRLYNAHVDKIAHGMCHTHQQARDVASDVFAHLFKPDSSGRCRIACYTGQSSLSMWIASIVKRRAINHCQTSGEVRAARAVPLDSLRLTPNPESNLVFETALLRCKYAKATEGSFKTAAAELDERERLVLAMRCDDDVTGKDIAEMLGLHPAQISRGADNFLGCH